MKIAVFPQDKGGCGSYRITWPQKALQAQGFDVREYQKPQLLHQPNGKVVGLAQPLDVDVVVFQRPARRVYLTAFEYFQSIGVRVVVDMDDDLSCVHPLNPAFIPYNQAGKDMHWEWAFEACLMADQVVCSTEALAERYGNGKNTVVVPNHIPESYLGIIKPESDLVRVGWAGIVATHPTDLQVTHGAVNEALVWTRGKSKFLALGDEKALYALGVRNKAPHVEVQAGVPIDKYPAFISQLDIGLVPLEDSPFNRAKSWLKALEYASVGVAPVVSPTPDNLKMVEAGAAVSAATPKEWKETIKLLIEDDQERKSLATKAKEFAATYSIEGNAEKWWNAWSGSGSE